MHPIKMALLVGLGGSIGALGRYYVAVGAQRWLGTAWPYGTLFANLLGCFILGSLTGMTLREGAVSLEMRALIMTGMLGAFTTFSTFSVESLKLLRESPAPVWGVLYILGSVLGGLLLAYLGYRLGMPALTPQK